MKSVRGAKSGPWVIFLEDPGAVNVIAPLLEKLVHQQVTFRLFADGQAMRLLRERGFNPAPLPPVGQPADDVMSSEAGLLILGTSENPESKGFDLTAVAKQNRIPSIAIIDAGVNSAYRFRGHGSQPLAHAPDWLLVPDEWTLSKYVELGFASERIAVVGHPNDDRLREILVEFQRIGRDNIRTQIFPAVHPDRRVVTFLSEVSTGLAPAQYQKSADYTLAGRGISNRRTEIVVEEVLGAIEHLVAEGLPRPYLVLRRHPKETAADLEYLVGNFDEVSVGGDPLSLVFASDLAIGMSSMLLVEAHSLGVKSLAVLPRESERDWLPEVRDGRIQSVTCRSELRRTMRIMITADYKRSSPPAIKGVSEIRVVDRIMAALESIVQWRIHQTTEPSMNPM